MKYWRLFHIRIRAIILEIGDPRQAVYPQLKIVGMKEEEIEDIQEKKPQKSSFWKNLPFFSSKKTGSRADSKAESEEEIKGNIQKHWQIIESDSQSQSKLSENEDDKPEQEQKEEVLLLRAQLQSSTQALERSELQRQLLELQNKRMRQQLQKWLKNPNIIRKYARVGGQLSFQLECDEVKMEKKSQLSEEMEKQQE